MVVSHAYYDSDRLLERVRSNDPVWRESGTAFINSVTRLLERLLDYRSVMQGDENCDKRMSCTVNLLVSNSDYFVMNSCIIFHLIYFEDKMLLKNS